MYSTSKKADLSFLNLDEVWIGKNFSVDGLGAAAFAANNEGIFLRIRNTFRFWNSDFFFIPVEQIQLIEMDKYPSYQIITKNSNIRLSLGLDRRIRLKVQKALKDILRSNRCREERSINPKSW